MSKKTVVIGATPKEDRYANRAVRMLKQYGHPVLALGWLKGDINGVQILTDWPEDKDVDTVTLYLNPVRQRPYYEYIIGLHPKRIIFNPGTENPELVRMAKENNIEAVEGCTLVMLSVGTY